MTTRDALRIGANLLFIPAGIVYNSFPRPERETVGAVARQSEPLLAAAGYAFAIWSLIFLGQALYAVYQALPANHTRALFRRIGLWTALNSLLGAAWTFAFTQRAYLVAWAIIFAMLVSLIVVELGLRGEARHGAELWLVRVPYGVNLGWVSVAVILNTTQVIHDVLRYDGSPLSPLDWSVIMTLVAATLGMVMVLLRHNLAFAAAVVWGLVGIAVYRWQSAPTLATTAVGSAVALLLVTVAAFVWRHSPRPTWREPRVA